jgi:hypothetical protein
MMRGKHWSKLGATLGVGLLQVGCYSGLDTGLGAAGDASSGAQEASDVGESDVGDSDVGDSDAAGSGSSESGEESVESLALGAGNQAPVIADPGPQVVDEDTWMVLVLEVRDPDDDPLRVWAHGPAAGGSLGRGWAAAQLPAGLHPGRQVVDGDDRRR